VAVKGGAKVSHQGGGKGDHAEMRVRYLIGPMLVLFLFGLTLVSIALLFTNPG